MAKKLVKLTEGDLHIIIKESVKKMLKETTIDNDSYFGGGLPDKYFNEDDDIEPTPECDGYVVADIKTDDIIAIFRNKNNAIKKCNKNYKWYFWGFDFND